MPWLVGIDEAGYGPNLGPLLMSAVACHAPEEYVHGNLWPALSAVVRRKSEPVDGRILVEDSKEVYSTTRGLNDLETSVLVARAPEPNAAPLQLKHYLDWVKPAYFNELQREAWYNGESALPLAADGAEIDRLAARFREMCQQLHLVWERPRSVVICPERFNRLVDHWQSKGAVLGDGLGQLLQDIPQLAARDSVWIWIDKHGGRNTYVAMLQHALPEGRIVVHQESNRQSFYSVLGFGQEIRIVIQPRADATLFCVALASMLSKYLREVLMHEFNDFWRQRCPDLKPTAGYPGDALRFMNAIRSSVEQLGLSEATLWRKR